MISNFKLGSEDYLTELADQIIGKLVKEKTHLFKAYNYYQGFRDKYQFEHLEKNYGIGNPTSVKFTPLIRKHIDAIVGEYLATKIQPKISCKDQSTLTNIMRDKQLQLALKRHQYVKQFLENAIYESIAGKAQQDLKTLDATIDLELKQIEDSVNLNFISNYEIAALNIILYIMQSRKIDFKSKLKQILLDLLIAGEAYYKVIPTPSQLNFQIEVEDPLNTFVFKNPSSNYLKDGMMSVIRKWMTREEIEIKYGRDLSKEDIKSLEGFEGYTNEAERLTWVAAVNSRGCSRTDGILAGVDISNYFDNEQFETDIELIPIYEVEWIDYNKSQERGVVYKVIRIGADIYILDTEHNFMPSSVDDPEAVRLSVNGIYYTNRTGVPYSLMLATADLQDLYDLTLFLKDNLIAQSGCKGAIVNVSELPEWLGNTPEERLIKWIGHRKTGIALIDPSQDGENNLNTIYTGFDDTLSLNAILGYQVSLKMIEEMASSITGVFLERLGGIEARDAVTNVEVGMLQSYIITKLYYQAMDVLVSEMLIDALNMAKIVFRNGFSGEIILGDKKEIFTALPEYYTFTDYDIHLADSAELIKEGELIKQLAVLLAQVNQADPEILLIVSTSKSLTEMKTTLMKSIKEKKIENNQIQLLTQLLQEAQSNMQLMQKQLEASTKKLATLNEKELAIKQQDLRAQQSIDWYKVKSEAENRRKELEIIEKRNQLEAALLLDNNPDNDEIQNDRI